MMTRRTLRGIRSGFSLVELLIVVSIIAILIALLLPSLSNARNAARTAVCQGNMRQISMGMLAYSAENQGKLLHDTHLSSWRLDRHQIGAVAGGSSPKHIQEYMNGTSVYFDARPNRRPSGPDGVLYCPAYERLTDLRNRTPFPGWNNRYPTNFQNVGPTYIARSYRVNDWLAAVPSSHGWIKGDQDKEVPRLHKVRIPSRLVLIGEGYNKNMWTSFGGFYHNPNHNDLTPAAMADGSAKMFTPEEAVGGPGIFWAPNKHISGGRFAVETWGTYLHPDYTKDL